MAAAWQRSIAFPSFHTSNFWYAALYMRKKRFVHWTASNNSYHRVAFTCLLQFSKAKRLRGRLSLPLVFAPTSNFRWNPPGSWVILILKKMNDKFHKNCESTGKILKSSRVRCNFVKFDIHFLGFPWEILISLVFLQMTYYIFSSWKCKKECNIL